MAYYVFLKPGDNRFVISEEKPQLGAFMELEREKSAELLCTKLNRDLSGKTIIGEKRVVKTNKPSSEIVF
jgi:hypothetical protein